MRIIQPNLKISLNTTKNTKSQEKSSLTIYIYNNVYLYIYIGAKFCGCFLRCFHPLYFWLFLVLDYSSSLSSQPTFPQLSEKKFLKKFFGICRKCCVTFTSGILKHFLTYSMAFSLTNQSRRLVQNG